MSGVGVIPNLPGYRKEVIGRGQFHKSHAFDVYAGHGATEVKRDVQIDPRRIIPASSFNGTGQLQSAGATIIRSANMVSSSSTATNYGTTGRIPEPLENAFKSQNQRDADEKYAHLKRVPVARDFENTAEPLSFLQLAEPSLPSWVEYDGKVLRFSGYFKEAVHASSSETWRSRPILLYYYLEDNTLHIAEPPVMNSGIPQGVIVKRHRVPKDERGNIFLVEDLFVGAQLPIYGRCYRLTDADAFTRAFYEKNGSPLEEPEDQPYDAFAKKSINPQARATGHRKVANPMTTHQEARLGKHLHGGIEETQKFLKNDGKVLRFYARYKDPQMYGETHAYRLHYFLADDTIEILTVPVPNSGYGTFPALLKRSKLPKDHTVIERDVAHVGEDVTNADPKLQFYHETDLRVGGYINVYGRELLLCGVDAYTKDYYMKHFGLKEEEMDSIHMKEPEVAPPRVNIPPETGFGTPEDSIGSFLHLVPRQPKTDQKKLHLMDGVLLRFSAQLSKPAYVDKERKFIVTYFLANDTLQVFELMERNTGHIAGKFLDRARTMNVRKGEFFQPADFYVGGVIEVNCTEFLLTEVDEYTRKFMDTNPHIWNAESGNLNDRERVLQLCGGKPLNSKAANTSNTLPNRRPF